MDNWKLLICIAILGVAGLGAAGSEDPWLILACAVVTAITIGLLWRRGEAPILVMVAGLQLSQVVILPFYANAIDVPLQTFSRWGRGDMTSATWFALAGMLSLVIGMWFGQLGRNSQADSIQNETNAWSPRRAFVFCVATIALSTFFNAVGEIFGGLRQPALAASQIQWIGVFVLACVCTAQRRGFGYLFVVAAMELVRGFTGFFADFKDVFIVLLVGIFTVQHKFRLGPLVAGVTCGALLLGLGSFWSEVKRDYRIYVEQGSRQQATVVPVLDRLEYLMDRASEFDSQKMWHGFDLLVRRVGYVEFLAATMQNVPGNLPFQNGAEVGTVLMHVLQPRLLFPDKPPLPNDTVLASRYTGIPFNAGGNARYTSISVGYLAELYVDFGMAGALLGVFVLGLCWGAVVKRLGSSSSAPSIINGGLAVALLMPMQGVELGMVKLTGTFLTTLTILLLFRRFLLPPLLHITNSHTQPTSSRRIPIETEPFVR